MATPISKTHFELLKESIQRAGTFHATISSDSMTPLIRTGDKIEIAGVSNWESLSRFDVLVFWDGKQLVCHYLWNINQLRFSQSSETLVTKGLNASWEDFPIKKTDILGVVKNYRLSTWMKLREYLRNLKMR